MNFIFEEGEQNPFPNGQRLGVEDVDGGYWTFLDGSRAFGTYPETYRIHRMLKWILEQVALGHSKLLYEEDGSIVGIEIGRNVPRSASSSEEAANEAAREHLAVQIAGLIARFREEGSNADLEKFEEKIWKEKNAETTWRMELSYGLSVCELLGRIIKKIPELELLPLVDNAPESTRQYLREATRCYLMKLNLACIALCRACLETTLQSKLTPQMRVAWKELIKENKRLGDGQPMKALIDICERFSILDGNAQDAHFIRTTGNKVLHMEDLGEAATDAAQNVLRKTRSIVGLFYSSRR